jgi:signal transduction histidine kinase
MKARGTEPFRELSQYLERKRGLVTRRWIRAIRNDPAMQQARRLTTCQLLDHLPDLFAEICAALEFERNGAAAARIARNARQHGHFRWMQGYQLDELFRELDLFRKCLQDMTSEFFAGITAPSRKLEEAQARRTIEELFSATMRGAVGQLLQEQDRRLAESLEARDRAEAARQESEERLRIAAAAAGLGIFEWDFQKRVGVWENARMYEITGQRPVDGPLSGDEFMRIIVHPDDVASLTEHFVAGIVPGRQNQLTFRIYRKNDHALRIVEMCGRVQFSDEGFAESFIGTLADITERRRAEEALREADRRKDVFLAMLAHELRNPLAPIRNAAQAMKDYRGKLPDDINWVQKIIERQCQHLSVLIDDLLDVSRITTGKIRLRTEVFDLKQAVTDAVEIIGPLADARQHSLLVSLPTDPTFVDGDPIRLTQVISNLLENAVKYTEDHGEIRVSVEVVDDVIGISVVDNGVGISAADLPHLFDLFVQVDPLRQQVGTGLGIGLSVVQSIVEMHGGEVSVGSAGPGRGSTFSVRLPLARPPTVHKASSPRSAKPVHRPLHILVVDDNRDAAESLAMILRINAHEVRVAEDGPNALQAATAWSPDIVLLDIGLPGMCGHDVARKLRALPQAHSAKLIALTGFGAEEDIARSAESGFLHHLVKPVDPAMLLSLLSELGAS